MGLWCLQEKFLKSAGTSCSIFTKRFLNDQYKDLKRQEILVQMYKFFIKAWLNLNVNLFNSSTKASAGLKLWSRFFMCNWSQINNSVGINNSAKMFISMLWCPVMNKHVIYILQKQWHMRKLTKRHERKTSSWQENFSEDPTEVIRKEEMT